MRVLPRRCHRRRTRRRRSRDHRRRLPRRRRFPCVPPAPPAPQHKTSMLTAVLLGTGGGGLKKHTRHLSHGPVGSS
eukprot:7822753-Pyramimonas_sp.AAC.1